MKFTATTILLFTTLISFSQLNSSMDILAGLNLSYRSIDDNGSSVENRRNDLEISKLNYHIGFNYNRFLTSRLYIKSGLRLASMGYKTKQIELVFPIGGQTNVQFIYDYLFLEIPLNLRFEFVENKTVVPFLEAGVSPSFYATNRAAQIQDGEERVYERIPLTADFRSFHLSANVAAGINYFTSSETSLFLQLNYKRHLTNLIDEDFKEKLFSYGIEIGLRRSLSNQRA